MPTFKYLMNLLLVTTLLASVAYGEEDDVVSFEGFVYNRTTLRPLKNADVMYAEVYRVPADGQIVHAAVDPYNFMYQLEVVPDTTANNHYIFVICSTSKGKFYGHAPLYETLKPIIYRRDVYIDMPAEIDTCDFPFE